MTHRKWGKWATKDIKEYAVLWAVVLTTYMLAFGGYIVFSSAIGLTGVLNFIGGMAAGVVGQLFAKTAMNQYLWELDQEEEVNSGR